MPERESKRATPASPTHATSPAHQGVESLADRVLSLQRSAGNAAVNAMLAATPPGQPAAASIQRQGPETGTAPGASAQTAAVWRIPFGLGEARTNVQAALGLLQMSQEFDEIARSGPEDARPRARSVIDSLNREARGFVGEEAPLTSRQVGQLNVISSLAQASHRQIVAPIRERLIEGLRTFRFRETTQIEAQLAEELHNAFIEGESPRRIGAIAEAIDKVKEYSSTAQSVCEWAGRTSSVIRSAERLEAIGERLEGLNEQIERVHNMLRVADSIAVLTGAEGARPGEMQNTIGQFRAGLQLIDVTVGVFGNAIPVFGQLWSQYYMPATEAILNGLTVIARAADREARQLQQIDWSNRPGRGETPPVIPRDYLTSSRFPGGQPVMDFMWRLVNDREPEMTPAVQQYFISFRSQFGAGLEERDQIEVEGGSHWYNPFSWGSTETSPNLLRWLRTNRDRVWAQLYGDLPHNI